MVKSKSKSLEHIPLESIINAKLPFLSVCVKDKEMGELYGSDTSFTLSNDERLKRSARKREGRSNRPSEITITSLRESVEGQITSPPSDINRELTPIKEMTDQSSTVKLHQEEPIQNPMKPSVILNLRNSQTDVVMHRGESTRKNEAKSNRHSEKRSFLEDEINNRNSTPHGYNLPKFSVDLEEDDDFFNQSLTNMPTVGKGNL